MKVDLPNNVKIPRSRVLSAPFFFPAACFLSPIDRSSFLPLHRAHEAPFYKEKKKTCSFPSTRHMARCVFFSFAADSPISPSRFSPVSESWIRTPSVHDGPRVQRPANMTGVSPIRVTNSPLFFLARARARSFFSLLLLLPLPLFSFLFVSRSAGRPSHTMRRKKISLKICLTVQPKLGPVLPIMGFLLAPRVSSNARIR